MSAIAEYEAERQAFQDQFNIVAGQLRDDPDNAELAELKRELASAISLLEEDIAALRPQHAPKSAPEEKHESASPPQTDKWSRENHSTINKKTVEAVEDKNNAPVKYNVNDTIMAKWVTGDKSFYPARITSITGSSTDPIYIVKFKSYGNSETLRSHDIKPVSNKRKADTAQATSTLTGTESPAPGVVTSAGATVYPEARQENDKSADAAKPPKPKKIKATKELEAGKNKWQDFNAKSKFGKKGKKDSMFRTPDGVHARVGFTGSGQAMRKDQTRSRHVYQMNEELD